MDKINTERIKAIILNGTSIKNNINNINKEAPMTCKIRINQPLFMFILI